MSRKEIDYDAFANVSSEINSNDTTHGYTGAVDQLFRFTGRYTDEDTGLTDN